MFASKAGFGFRVKPETLKWTAKGRLHHVQRIVDGEAAEDDEGHGLHVISLILWIS